MRSHRRVVPSLSRLLPAASRLGSVAAKRRAGHVTVAAQASNSGSSITFTVQHGERASTVAVPAGWAVDHDAATFQKVTYQRKDPVPHPGGRKVLGIERASEPSDLCDEPHFRVRVSATSDLQPSPPSAVTTWGGDAQQCVVPESAITSAVVADSVADGCAPVPFAKGSTHFHQTVVAEAATAARRNTGAMAPSPTAAAVAASAGALTPPECWTGNDSNAIVDAATLGSYAVGASGSEPRCSRRVVLRTIAQYGFCVVRDLAVRNGIKSSQPIAELERLPIGSSFDALNEPPTDKGDLLDRRVGGIAALGASIFGTVRNTHYGTVSTWGDGAIGKDYSDGDGPDHLDTAYVPVGIGLHTDSTYFVEPPALQVFGCVHRCPNRSRGGESQLADGYAVAKKLRDVDPQAFEILTRTPVLAVYCKEQRAFMGARPVISLSAGDADNIVQVTFNPYDRAPFPAGVLEVAELERFYAAYTRFGQLAAAEAASFQLHVGDVLFFNNLRMLHARTAYSGPRIMSGVYVGSDDLASAFADAALAAP